MKGNNCQPVDLDSTLNFLKQCLAKHASSEALLWLENKQKQIFEQKTDALYFITFSLAPQYFGKEIIPLTQEESNQASIIHSYWHLKQWSLDQAARIYLVLKFARDRLDHFEDSLNKLFNAAGIYELIALYQGLPFFPCAEKFLLHATNGIRSNMVSVFEAIALNNSYPADYFNEIAWNQLVLKAFFVDSPLEQIVGLKRRANPFLAQALIDMASERAAANRSIKLETWYLIGLSVDQKTWPLLKNLLDSNNSILYKGVLIAVNCSELKEAKELLNESGEKRKEIQQELNKLSIFSQKLI